MQCCVDCREDECELCKLEKKTKKKDLVNPNCHISKCHLAEMMLFFPKYLAAHFGYQVDNWYGSNPINLPFALGEISNEFLGSGTDEGLAHIYRLLVALGKKRNKPELNEAIGYFLNKRAQLWANVLKIGKIDKQERAL